MKWEAISLDEQETIINFNYYEKKLNLYTSRPVVYKKLFKKIGKPTKTHISNNLVYGADWRIPFEDRKKNKKYVNFS